MMLKAKFEEEDEEYDTYDPFGEIDTEGRDVATAPSGDMEPVEKELTDTRVAVTNPEGENAELEKDLVKRFANYGWTKPGHEADQDLRCSYPEGKGTKQFGEIRVNKVTKPGKKRSIGDTTDEVRVCSSFQIRPEWWEPAVWWLENTKWTHQGLAQPGIANKIKMMATWVELALVFQIQTGVRLAPESLDLKSQETVFRSIIKRIWSRSKLKIAGITKASKNVWGPVSSSPSCRPLIDHSRSGIGRRPIVCNEIWTTVAEIITAAFEQATAGRPSGWHGR